jgi:hypothetical protein
MKNSLLQIEEAIRTLDRKHLYSDDQSAQELFSETIRLLTSFHFEECVEYQRILFALWGWTTKSTPLVETPFIPARIFKEHSLRSCEESEIVKTLTSSGTSGSKTSMIFLDSRTSKNQSRVLSRIMSSFLGTKRLPMLVVDSPSIGVPSGNLSARGAALNGFRMSTSKVTYALDHNLELQADEIRRFYSEHGNSDFLVFGFTSIVWEACIQILESLGNSEPAPGGILLHGGGWKKLADKNIAQETFRTGVGDALGIQKVINYYGMAEQTGSIFFECTSGHFHSTIYSHILIRDPLTLELLPEGEIGIIQLQSVLPLSYPGHSILTEDIGKIDGRGNCKCGRAGTRFKVLGRLAEAEVRGCSNVSV